MAKKFPIYPWVEPKVKIGQPIFSPYEESPVARAPVVPRTPQLINPAVSKDNFLRGSKAAVAGPMPQIPIPTQRVFTSTPVPTATATPAPFRPQYMLEGLRENRVPTQVSLPAGVPTNYPTYTPAPPTATQKSIDKMSYEERMAAFPWMKLTATLKPGENWIQDLENSQQTATAEATNPKGVVTQTPHWWDPPPTRTPTAKPSATATATAGPSPTATPTATPSAIPTWKAPPNGFQTATPAPFRPQYMLEGLRENRAIPVEKPKPKPVGPKGYQDPAAGEVGIPPNPYVAPKRSGGDEKIQYVRENKQHGTVEFNTFDTTARLLPGNAEQSKYDDLIYKASQATGINAVIIKAIIGYESEFVPDAPNPGGDDQGSGLMQVSDKAKQDVFKTYGDFGLTKGQLPTQEQLKDPWLGILYGAHYLKWVLDLPHINGDFKKAIAGYNGGAFTSVDKKTGKETTFDQKLNNWWEPDLAITRTLDRISQFTALKSPFTEERGGLQGGIKKDQGKYNLGFQSSRDDLSLIEKAPITQPVMPVTQNSAAVKPPAASTFLNMGSDFLGYNLVPVSEFVDANPGVQVSANVNNVLEPLVNEWQQTSDYTVKIDIGYRGYDAQGKIDPKRTKAKPGQSSHQTGYSFDIYFYDKNGKVVDDNHAMLSPLHTQFYEIAKKYGLIKPLSWDTPHYLAAQTLLDDVTPTLNLTEQGKLMIQEYGPKIKNGTLTNSEANSIMQVAFGKK